METWYDKYNHLMVDLRDPRYVSCNQRSSLINFPLNKPYDEVLGAAQFTERTSISCQKLSKVVKSCQKLSKVVISCHKLS